MEQLSSYPKEGARHFERKPYGRTIVYSLAVPVSEQVENPAFRGRAIDISDAGLGIETDYPLAPGHVLWVNGGINRSGVVRWCREWNGNYRAGIELSLEAQPASDKAAIGTAAYVGEEPVRYHELLAGATERFTGELKALEKRCSDPSENPEKLLRATEKAMDGVLAACAEFEQGVKDKKIIRSARVSFHEKTNPVLSRSFCINRVRTWPQGSQGDYKTLEYVYKNTPLSEGLGYYLDLYILNSTLAHAVRNRIKRLEEMLGEEIGKKKQPSVLNIGCGSCRELMGIAPEIMDSEAKIICVDMDNDALAFAQDRLSYAGIISQVELRRYNALRMFDAETNMAEFGNQDIIYSVGLFDYLPTDFLVKLLPALYRLLNPGGKLIAAFKDAARYRSQDYHWIADWDGFLQRKGEDFRAILSAAGIPHEAISETREESGVIVFYSITKAETTEG